MCQKRRNSWVILRLIAVFWAIFIFAIINNDSAFAEAVITNGVFIDDATDIRWEWELDNDTEREAEPQKVTIKFYDKPTDLNTVTVPSLSTVINKVPGASSTLNTYYLNSANVSTQDTNYTELTRREANTNTIKLDMTNTSKIQILGVSPIIDPGVETELVFGQNMVIGDNVIAGEYSGAFAGYKLKLTNFDAANFNYVGWEAFANTKISGQTITISGNSFKGGNIFKNSNLKNVTIETENIGAGIFRDCQHLETVTYANSVAKVTDDAFANTNLASFDFSTTSIKTIGPRAFDGAALTSINLGGVNRIEYRAFANTQITEVILPKTINYLESELFKGASNLKKLTVAYDTLTSGTILPMFVVLDNEYPNNTLEELHVIAPYGADEALSSTHISYKQYQWHYNRKTREYLPDCPEHPSSCTDDSAARNDYVNAMYGAYNSQSPNSPYRGYGSDFEYTYANIDTYKNVIAPIYFANLTNLHKITIGEGYEFIGASAFQDWSVDYNNWTSGAVLVEGNENSGHELNLPTSLKGVGNGAFANKFQDRIDFSIPRNIEFIGINAFRNTYFYDKDVDFPNLIALGDHAFEKTRTKNIHLYDKLQYMGAQVFSDCLFLNNITFDLDVFNPNIYIAWALPNRYGPSDQSMEFRFTTEFGPRNNYNISNENIEKYGLRINEDRLNVPNQQLFSYYPLKFGTITFTDKNVSQLPNGYVNSYYIDTTNAVAQKNCFFGHINADKIDIGNTSWKVLSPRMFVQSSIDEIVLPKNLEVIPGDSFSDTFSKKELILPNSVKVIGDAAFNYGLTKNFAYIIGASFNAYDGWANTEWLESHQIKITKLPSSLEYVGNDAFYGDYNLTADLSSSNLRTVGYKAFFATRIRNVYLPPSVKELHAGAFALASALNDITIDFDLGALAPNYAENFNPANFPQSFRDYAGDYLFPMLHMSLVAYSMANGSSYGVVTFYNIFNQKMASTTKQADNHFGKLTFTENATTAPWMFNGGGYFAGLEFDEVDLSASGWKTITGNNMNAAPYSFEDTKIGKLSLPTNLETMTMGAFENAEVEQPFALPETLKILERGAFQNAKVTITNMLPDSVESIGDSAFYGTDAGDNVIIPAAVTNIGSSAFNAGPTDVHYDTITIEPDLTIAKTHDQLVHQIFWSVDVDKMVVESKTLPGYEKPDFTELSNGGKKYYEEFWNMPFDEIEITSLPMITFAAFNRCSNLKKVDMSKDAALSAIRDRAFENDEKLDTILFSPSIKEEIVAVGNKAFRNTGFKSVGQADADFNLRAAHFDAGTEVFSDMKQLTSVDVPETFSNGTIPAYTFYNDAELKEANVAYKVKLIDNAAFANDNKLARIFIWGDTVINDENLPGYTAPAMPGMGYVEEDTPKENVGPTIPEGTDIYAYSSWHAEPYAGSTSRDSFDGEFYPLDEVLYLTSNKTHVKINDEETDFDKFGLIVYGLRRDGVVLESDSWSDFDGNAYLRTTKDLNFAKMAPAIAEDPAFATVWDTPVPLAELSLANENFANIDFELVKDTDENEDVRLVNIIYTDAYTKNKPDTDVLPLTEGGSIIPGTPITLDDIVKITILFIIATISGAAALIISRKNYRRR